MSSPGIRIAAISLAGLSLLGVAGCGSSGRELRDYPTGQTAPPRNAPAAGTLEDGSTTQVANVFALSTDEWTPDGPMPSLFTCDGTGVSPNLAISSPPEGTVEMAIVVKDLDADGLVHWAMAGIAPDTTTIAEATVPPGAVQALASNDEVGWFGPCPPAGETHTYEFSLYALGSPSGVVEGQSADSAVKAIEAASTNRSTLTATYRR